MRTTIGIRAGMLTIALAGLQAQAAPEPIDACALLTKQEASAAVGGPVGEPKAAKVRESIMPGTAASSCEYASTTGASHVHLNVWRAAPNTAGQLQQMGQMVCGQKTRDGLAGLGDIACWYSAEHEELQVFKGATFFSIELRRKNPTEPIKMVAKAVLPRLP